MTESRKRSKPSSRGDELESRQLTLEDWAQTLEEDAGNNQPASRGSASRRSEVVAGETQAEFGAVSLLTTREVADALHIHPRTVQRLVERGELAVVRLGAAIRFDPAELVRLIGERTRMAPSHELEQETLRARTPSVSFARRLRSKPA